MADIYIAGTQELSALARKLKEVGDNELSKELSKQVRRIAAPIVADLKSEIKSLPVTGARGRGRVARAEYDLSRMKNQSERAARRAEKRAGLRDTIARAIKADQRLSGNAPSVKISVKENLLPPDQRKLPKHLDSPDGWRHPVFGNREVWAVQKGRPWWLTTIKPHAENARKEILDAAKSIVERSIRV